MVGVVVDKVNAGLQVAALDFDYENLTKQQFDQMKKAAIKNQRK